MFIIMEYTGEYTVENYAHFLREELKKLEKSARWFISKIKQENDEDLGNKWETIAQATLWMRHIEDARMKYWKVIQYSNPENQESIFDKKKED